METLNIVFSFTTSIVAFAVAAAVIGFAGVAMTARAESLARYTGLGQAVLGAVFVGAATSLSGSITSIAAALSGHPSLAVSNALGGIAAQTAFLAVADIVYRKANLEHAAASQENLMYGALLIVLLSLAVLATVAPDFTLWQIHPMSLMLIGVYGYGINLVAETREAPMWFPRRTVETRFEPPAERPAPGGLIKLWASFAMLAVVVAVAGWAVARAGVSIAQHTGLSETLVGTLFTAVSTSLPELVVAITAVRRGALTLAVGDIIGGNTFDVLILAFADAAYRSGSIYHVLKNMHTFWMALAMLLTGILLLGLIKREAHGIGNIGFESFFVLLFYLLGVVLLVWSG